jgi:IS1 family transposase
LKENKITDYLFKNKVDRIIDNLLGENKKKKYEEFHKNFPEFKIKEMLGDGNCLYRAVAYKIFGDEDNYK